MPARARQASSAAGVRVPAPVAALVNGTAAHSYELDDTHDPSMSHPASVVIPAALAVAAECDSTGEEVVAAVVAGYEAMTRIGTAANASHVIEFGFHPTALFGGFGAAAAAAKLRGLDSEGLRCAWGHALSMASGSMQFSDETTGTAVKRTHAGYAAQQGVLSVELAVAGIEAPQRALDGKYGFFKLYGREARPELLRENPARFAIHDISFKPYACCRQFHSHDRRAAYGDGGLCAARIGAQHHGARAEGAGRPAHAAAAGLADGGAIQPAVRGRGDAGDGADALRCVRDREPRQHRRSCAGRTWCRSTTTASCRRSIPRTSARRWRWASPTAPSASNACSTAAARRRGPSPGTSCEEKALALTAPCRPPLDLGLLRELIQGLPKANDVVALERLLTGEPAEATASSRKAKRA